MAHERRRAALAALCVFAVALAATLLPASGFGSQPAGVGGGGDAPDAPAGDGVGPDDPASTSTPDPRTSTPGNPTPTTSAGGSEDSTPTTERTTTASETTTGVAGSGGGGLRDALGVVIVAALGVVGLLCVVGFWTGALAVSTAATGPLPFTVVVGGTPIGELVGAVPTRTMALVIGLSASVPRLLDDAATLTGEVGRSLGTVLGSAARGTAEALRIGARGLAVTLGAVPRALAGLAAGAGVLSSVGSVGLPSLGRDGSDDGADRQAGRIVSDDPEETGPPSIEEAWQAMRDRVPVSNRDARTPGEVARAAARRGYPDEEVRRLTDAFREVRYGDLPRDDRTDSARSALDRLRDYWRGER